MQDVLYPALARHFGKPTETPGAHDALLGADWLTDAVFVDQCPIGKTARSNPASYVGAFDEIRKLFAQAPLARSAATAPGMFSFNAGDGRCATCGGSGFEHVEMQFLSDVYLRCPDCDGRRYRAEILDVKLDRWCRATAGWQAVSPASADGRCDTAPSAKRCSCSATTARCCACCNRSSTSASNT